MTNDRQQGAEVGQADAAARCDLNGVLVLLCWALIVVGLYWPFISGQKLVGYRDAIQFYWPMFQWADEVWAAGELPLWNPYDGLGRSHLGEGISSVFYPGKLVFWARWLSFESRFGWYLALHVWLAGFGAAWCAKQFGIDSVGRAIALLSYGLAGPVLFASTNVVFLVSAAWLPWGLGAVWRWRQRPSRWSSVSQTGATAALMILGGDPQMAYNLLLIAAGSWMVWAVFGEPKGSRSRRTVEAAVACAGLAVLTSVLAAAQILPSLEAARGSERAAFAQPRTLVEWCLGSWQRGEPLAMDAIWAETDFDGHQSDVYDFSQPPWTVGEWIWPGSSGRPFPIWTHWASSLPGSGRMWQPSLYQGVIVIVLAASVLLHRGVARWLVLLGLLGCLAGFGWYGPVWLANEVGLATGWWQPWEGVNRAVGGVYWLLTNLVPGYIWFRYPAKLMVPVSLVVALLAAWAWGRGNRRVVECGLLGIAGVSAILLFTTWLIPWDTLSFRLSGDDWFGPWDAERYCVELRRGIGQAAVFCLLGWWASRFRDGLGIVRWQVWLPPAFMAIDLLLANAWLLPAVESRSWQPLSPAANLPVYWGQSSAPVKWSEETSENRLEEVVTWELAEAFPRLHWLTRERMLNAPGTIESQDWQAFLDWVEKQSSQSSNASPNLQAGRLSWQQLFEAEPVWLLEHAPTSIDMQGVKERATRLGETFAAGVVEPAEVMAGDESERTDLSRVGRVVGRTEQSVSIQVDVPAAGVIFLSEAYAPGWRVRGVNTTTSEPFEHECISVGRWLRGIRIQPGVYELEFIYAPRSMYWGIYLSLAGWSILLFKAAFAGWNLIRFGQFSRKLRLQS